MFNYIDKKSFLFLLLLNLSVFVFFVSSGDFIEHGDLTNPYLIDSVINTYKYLFHNSLSQSNLESINRSLFFLPVSYLFKFFGFKYGYIVYSFFISFSLFLSQISIILLCNRILSLVERNHLTYTVSIFIGISYSMSPWVREVYPAILFLFAYAAFPIFLYLLLDFKNNKNLIYCFFFSLVVTFIGTTPHYLLFAFITFLIFFIFNIKNKFFWINSFKSLLLYLPMNIYWLYPSFLIYTQKNISPGYVNSSDFVNLFSQNISILKIFQGQEIWISWFKYDKFFTILNNKLFLILPVLSLLSVVFFCYKRFYKKIPEISTSFLLFFILSMGSVNGFYLWLLFKSGILSGFDWLFRVPFKFGFFYWIFLFVSISLMVSYHKRTGLMLLFFIGLYSFPQSFLYLFHYYKPFYLPDNIRSVILDSKDLEGRTMFLSPFGPAFNKNLFKYETSHTWNQYRMSSTPFTLSFLSPAVAYYHTTFRDWQDILYSKIYPEYSSTNPEDYITYSTKYVLDKFGISNVVIANDLLNSGDSGNRLVERFRDSGFLLDKKYGNDIFLFKTGVNSSLFSNKENNTLEFKKNNPSSYNLVPESDYVVFKQPFDPLWIMESNKGEIVKPHKTGDGLCGYDIPYNLVKSDMNLEYYPQTTYYKLLLFSIAYTIFFGFCIMLLNIFRHLKNT